MPGVISLVDAYTCPISNVSGCWISLGHRQNVVP